ncbi:hypothetical protein PoB_005099400 [Plakobranchus ocellatus]|uniref:Uncharacterized protein n=1 Tax=Plakobranchus ocellatus TaxID=259542 RepID=A0AAV4C040_9GAST|nr:hypothetical protein PoB_005099400 [Plakobranchus ocellatus]
MEKDWSHPEEDEAESEYNTTGPVLELRCRRSKGRPRATCRRESGRCDKGKEDTERTGENPCKAFLMVCPKLWCCDSDGEYDDRDGRNGRDNDGGGSGGGSGEEDSKDDAKDADD